MTKKHHENILGYPQDFIDNLLKVGASQCKTVEDVNSFLKQFTGPMLEQMMQGELEAHLGYEKHAVSGYNTGNSRNGSYKKRIQGSGGDVEIKVPRDRNGEFEPQIIPKYQSSTPEVEQKIINMYALGLSTHDISWHIEDIYGAKISADMVSMITDKILPVIEGRQSRPLDSCYPVVFLDAIHCKVKENETYVMKAVYIVVGYGLDGYKDILGFYIGEEETSKFWHHVCNDLANRGVKDICIACVDGLPGFSTAIRSVFGEKVEVQRCIVHQIRNSLRHVSYKYVKGIKQDLAKIYKAVSIEMGEKGVKELREKWGMMYPSMCDSWENNWSELSTYFQYGPMLRRMIYTTNIIESLNASLRKVIRKGRTFPSEKALRKIVYLSIANVTRKWTMPVANWGQIINQLRLEFPEKLGKYL